jgi:hypothetical protein
MRARQCLRGLAAVALARGEWERAARLLGACGAPTVGRDFVPAWEQADAEQIAATLRGRLGDAAFESASDRGRTLSFDEAVALALEP